MEISIRLKVNPRTPNSRSSSVKKNTTKGNSNIYNVFDQNSLPLSNLKLISYIRKQEEQNQRLTEEAENCRNESTLLMCIQKKLKHDNKALLVEIDKLRSEIDLLRSNIFPEYQIEKISKTPPPRSISIFIKKNRISHK